jgi:hypothetical protein
MIIFLFSLKSYDFWPVLMAHLLLHDFLHLFIYDAAKTSAHVVQYKKSNRGTVLNSNKFRMDIHFNPAASQNITRLCLFSPTGRKERKRNILCIKTKKTNSLGAAA